MNKAPDVSFAFLLVKNSHVDYCEKNLPLYFIYNMPQIEIHLQTGTTIFALRHYFYYCNHYVSTERLILIFPTFFRNPFGDL